MRTYGSLAQSHPKHVLLGFAATTATRVIFLRCLQASAAAKAPVLSRFQTSVAMLRPYTVTLCATSSLVRTPVTQTSGLHIFCSKLCFSKHFRLRLHHVTLILKRF